MTLLFKTGLAVDLVLARLPPCSRVIYAKAQKMALATSRVKMALPRQEVRWHCHFVSVQKMA